MRKLLTSVFICLAIAVILISLPCLFYTDRAEALFFPQNGMDAVSSATFEIPDRPTGEFVILLNKDLHSETLGKWEDFFSERPVDVIFEDLSCLVISGDSAGIEAAERYRVRLAENQMEIDSENSLLAVSRVQWGRFDVFVCSAEIAEALRLDTVYDEDYIHKIVVTDGSGGA